MRNPRALVIVIFGIAAVYSLIVSLMLWWLISPDVVPWCEDRASDYCQALAEDRADD